MHLKSPNFNEVDFFIKNNRAFNLDDLVTIYGVYGTCLISWKTYKRRLIELHEDKLFDKKIKKQYFKNVKDRIKRYYG